MSDPTAQVLRSRGGPICFADFGPRDGYPVLFMHQTYFPQVDRRI